MNIKNTFFWFLILYSQFSVSQTFWKTYDYLKSSPDRPAMGTGIYIDEIQEGYLIFNHNFGGNIGLMKVDEFGEVLENKEFDLSIVSKGNTITKDTVGDYYLVGRTDYPETDILLVKFSGKTLDSLWTKRFYLPNWEEPSSVKIYNNKINILARTDSLLLQDNILYTVNAKLLFLTADLKGNLIDTVHYQGEYQYTYLGDFDFLPTGNIAVTYTSNASALFPGVGYRSIFDENFRLKREDVLGGAHSSHGPRPLLVISRDSTTIYYYYIKREKTFFPDRDTDNGVVTATTIDGELLWETILPAWTFSPRSIKMAKNGDIIGSGYHSGTFDFPTTSSRIFKLNKDGDVLFDHHYHQYHDNEILDEVSWMYYAREASNEEIIAVGKAGIHPDKIPERGVSDVYFLKLDGNGCLISTCDSLVHKINSTVNISDLIGQKLNVYPNPTEGIIELKLPDSFNTAILSIFSPTGEKVFQKGKIYSGSQVNISHLPQGIYFYKIHDQNRQIGNGKVVVH